MQLFQRKRSRSDDSTTYNLSKRAKIESTIDKVERPTLLVNIQQFDDVLNLINVDANCEAIRAAKSTNDVIKMVSGGSSCYYHFTQMTPMANGRNYEASFKKLNDAEQQFERVKDDVKRYLALPESFWNPTHDFLYKQSASRLQGGEVFYSPPEGTVKIACNVTNVPGNFWESWPVAYHGTKWGNIKSILTDRLRIRGGGRSVKKETAAVHGEGLYCTPCITTAQCYTEAVVLGGKSYNPVMFVRVLPGKLEKPVSGISRKVLATALALGVNPQKLKQPEVWKLPDERDVEVIALLFVPA